VYVQLCWTFVLAFVCYRFSAAGKHITKLNRTELLWCRQSINDFPEISQSYTNTAYHTSLCSFTGSKILIRYAEECVNVVK
jgi:hypothetical protein